METTRTCLALTFTGVAAFGTYHWFFVAPVVAVFLEGALWAVGAGFAMAWAYQRTMLDRGRRGVAWGLAFGALFAATLVPNEIAGLWIGPLGVEEPGDILTALPFAFLAVPLAVVIGWVLEGRMSWSFLVMVMSVHFMIGGSLTNFGGRGASFVLFCMFVAMEILAGAILGYAARADPRDGPHRGDSRTHVA